MINNLTFECSTRSLNSEIQPDMGTFFSVGGGGVYTPYPPTPMSGFNPNEQPRLGKGEGVSTAKFGIQMAKYGNLFYYEEQ